MDFFTFLLLVIAILAVMALLYWILFKKPAADAALEINKVRAQQDLADTILRHVTRNTTGKIYAIDLKTLAIKWMPEDDAAIGEVHDPVSANDVKLHRAAEKLIDISIDADKHLDALGDTHKSTHNHGVNGTWLLTAQESVAVGLFTSERDWQAVRDYIKVNFGLMESNNKGDGTRTLAGQTLYDLRIALAKRPPTPKRVDLLTQKDGNSNGRNG